MKKVEIIKANGDKAIFEIDKLIRSLKKSGASHQLSLEIAEVIESGLFDGMTTKEIYRKAFNRLRKKSRSKAARYKLKNAIMELGPSGFPFEKYVAELLKADGFQTDVGKIVKGQCVSHEIDIVASKNNQHYMCECKFHSKQGRHCDVKIPLYIQSRFKDLENTHKKKDGSNKFHQGWIFTNTRFTSDAMKYGKCAGLKLISWDYPKRDSMKIRVDRFGIHPITCLTTLTSREKKALLDIEKVLCKDLCNEPESLDKVGIKKIRHHKILEEAHALCGI